jgi:UDP-N-acetylglucosamine acyltransferase
MTEIHPTAVIEPEVELGEGVIIEAYAVIKGRTKLGKGVVVKAHAYIDGNTTIGEGSIIYPGARIGTRCQHQRFQGEETFVTIGRNCEVREFATINSSTDEGSRVVVGDDCLVMAYAHIAHDCYLGRGVTMSNNATLAGHVSIDDYAIVGGMTPVHQRVRIGRFAFVGGLSRVSHDIPPYTLVGGNPCKIGGLNLVGLKRHGFSFELRCQLTKAFRLVYRSGLHLNDALSKIESELDLSPEMAHWVDFCRTSQRGLIDLRGIAARSSSEEFSDYHAYAEDVVEEEESASACGQG